MTHQLVLHADHPCRITKGNDRLSGFQSARSKHLLIGSKTFENWRLNQRWAMSSLAEHRPATSGPERISSRLLNVTSQCRMNGGGEGKGACDAER